MNMIVEDSKTAAEEEEKSTFSTDKEVRNAAKKDKFYKLRDSMREGLYLRVQPSGKKLWQYRFTLGGKDGTFSIGQYPAVTLSEARDERDKACKWVREGTNPIVRKKEELRAKADESEATLAKAWEGLNLSVVDISPKTMARREREFAKDLGRHLNRAVTSFTKPELASILKKISARAPSVAHNIHGYLNGAFEHAVDIGWLPNNPVPKVSILGSKKPKSHLALPPKRLGDFLVDLDKSPRLEAKSRVSMLLAILCAVRKQEATGARWSEVDLERGEWMVPAGRMKGQLDHYVPLSKQAIDLLRQWRTECDQGQDFLFPNRRDPKRPMAGRTLNNVMDKLGYLQEGVPHGMRACFSTYANDRYKHHADAIERCLAHVEKNKVRGVYNRYEYKRERKKLMQAWGDQLAKLRNESEARLQVGKEAVDTVAAEPVTARPMANRPTSQRGFKQSRSLKRDRLAGFRSARSKFRHNELTSARGLESAATKSESAG